MNTALTIVWQFIREVDRLYCVAIRSFHSSAERDTSSCWKKKKNILFTHSRIDHIRSTVSGLVLLLQASFSFLLLLLLFPTAVLDDVHFPNTQAVFRYDIVVGSDYLLYCSFKTKDFVGFGFDFPS